MALVNLFTGCSKGDAKQIAVTTLEARMSEDFTYDANDIEEVTGGRVRTGLLRLWIAQARLSIPSAPTSQGKRRMFSEIGVCEVAVLNVFACAGVPMDTAVDWTRSAVVPALLARHRDRSGFAWRIHAVDLGIEKVRLDDDIAALTQKLSSGFSILNLPALITEVEVVLSQRERKKQSIES